MKNFSALILYVCHEFFGSLQKNVRSQLSKVVLVISIFVVGLAVGDFAHSASKAAAKEISYTMGSTSAVSGGNLVSSLRAEPPTIHPITSTDYYADVIKSSVLDTLLVHDYDNYEWKPRLAEKWEISKDGKTFTFYLRKNAFFHDGKPVTAEDVKFSLDAIFEPKYEAAHMIPYYEQIEKAEIVDPYTIKFYAKDQYFLNFDTVATMYIKPKHIYSDVEKSKKMNKELVGSGPYVLHKFDKGQKIVLKKFDKWYGNELPLYKGIYNFEYLTYRFVKEDNVRIEMLQKGDLDYDSLTPEQYVKKTEGAPWGDTLIKSKVENRKGKGYRYIGWKMDHEIFKDRNVRVAMAHLMNREEMNQKFRYGMSVLATGPVDLHSDYASPNVKPFEFNPKKAQELLTKAGWKDSDKDGILDKQINGKKVDFKFSLIHANKDYEKYLTFYKEDLKKAGIEMEIKFLEWNSFVKALESRNFEAVHLAWTTKVDWDPKQIWHSSSAVAGGSNHIGYKNKEVDDLIEKARRTMERKDRIPILRQVYEKIASDAPYLFWFNEKNEFYANHKKIGRMQDTYKYDVGTDYWWMKP